jgi:hypothetical protein
LRESNQKLSSHYGFENCFLGRMELKIYNILKFKIGVKSTWIIRKFLHGLKTMQNGELRD